MATELSKLDIQWPPVEAPKREPGRPRKHPKRDTDAPKRGRGRPRIHFPDPNAPKRLRGQRGADKRKRKRRRHPSQYYVPTSIRLPPAVISAAKREAQGVCSMHQAIIDALRDARPGWPWKQK